MQPLFSRERWSHGVLECWAPGDASGPPVAWHWNQWILLPLVLGCFGKYSCAQSGAVDTSPWPGFGTFFIAMTSSVSRMSPSLSASASWHGSSSAVPASISLSSPQPTRVPIPRALWGHPPCEHPGSVGRKNQQQSWAERRGGGGGGGRGQDKGEFENLRLFPPLPVHPLHSAALETPRSEDSNPVGERKIFQCCYHLLLPFPTV